MLLSCKLNCCVVPHMPGRRKKRDGNLNYWLPVLRVYNSFSSFSEYLLFFFFFTFVLLILLRSQSSIKILLPELRENGRQPILGQANCSSGQPGWGPHHGRAVVRCRQLYLGLQSAPARLLSRHRGQKSISNKLHFPELLRRRR